MTGRSRVRASHSADIEMIYRNDVNESDCKSLLSNRDSQTEDRVCSNFALLSDDIHLHDENAIADIVLPILSP